MKLPRLNLPEFEHKFRLNGSKAQIYDIIRKKYVALSPEEWVRQSFIKHLTQNHLYPSTRLTVELKIDVCNLIKRCDLVAFDKNLHPIAVFEFKAPHIELNQAAAAQIGAYNINFKINNLIISNGISHYWLKLNNQAWSIEERIPDYNELQWSNDNENTDNESKEYGNEEDSGNMHSGGF